MNIELLLRQIPDCTVHGFANQNITGITANSKHILPGNLFIVRKGECVDGRHFIPEAIQAGARAILTDKYDDAYTAITQVIHPSPGSLESILASRYYAHPSNELFLTGITGTNGKTTTAYIIKHLLDHFEGPCGLMGTIEYLTGNKSIPATHTTPDASRNQKLLREMVNQGCKAAVMEVTSHALDQCRVDENIEFDAAIFTNLTQDHLDYHQTLVNYGNAKKLLFDQLHNAGDRRKLNKWAIVNRDSPWSAHMLGSCAANVITYGIDSPCDIKASDIVMKPNGTSLTVSFQNQSKHCFFPLTGRFNVYNCLAAMGVALIRHIPLEKITEHLAQINLVQGRLQAVKNHIGINLYVDFAHTENAMANILTTLREITAKSGRLIVVFGCGGDRDRTKRPRMGEVCEKLADYSIVTSDNSRSEDPHHICKEIAVGFLTVESYEIIIDRRSAIQKALEMARPGDTVLIAGKGHEPYQITGNKTVDFNDAKVATELCNERIATIK